MREVAVIGAAVHPFGKFGAKTVGEMIVETASKAVADAGVQWRDIGCIGAASSHFSGGMGWGLTANELQQAMCMSGVPVYNCSAACAAGGSAFNTAYTMVATGQCDVALAVAGEKMPKGFIPRPPGAADDISDNDYLRWAAIGFPNTGYWAMETRRRMVEYGTTEAHLAKVAVKAHRVGAQNPNARYRKVLSLEDVLTSNMVSDPLRLYEICAVSDAAAAVVLCSADKARQYAGKPVTVAATALATGRFGDPAIRVPEISTTPVPGAQYYSEVVLAVKRAYEMSGLGPKDVSFIELQDNSVWQELAWPELFGVLQPGEGDWLVDRDQTGVDGKMPINPSGGFLSFGEATTVMGVWQVCEATTQLRGRAGARQVNNPRVALCATLGLGANGSAVILKA